MSIEVNIDGDAINAAVTQAVLDSVIGEQMKKAISETLKPSSFGRQSAIESVVSQEVQKLVRQVIEEEYGDQIKDEIRKQLTDNALQQIVGASTQALLNELDRMRR